MSDLGRRYCETVSATRELTDADQETIAELLGPSRLVVRVADLRPGDVLVGSSRTVVTTPGRDAQTRRRRVQLVVRYPDGSERLVTLRAGVRVHVRRPAERADIDG